MDGTGCRNDGVSVSRWSNQYIYVSDKLSNNKKCVMDKLSLGVYALDINTGMFIILYREWEIH